MYAIAGYHDKTLDSLAMLLSSAGQNAGEFSRSLDVASLAISLLDGHIAISERFSIYLSGKQDKNAKEILSSDYTINLLMNSLNENSSWSVNNYKSAALLRDRANRVKFKVWANASQKNNLIMAL